MCSDWTIELSTSTRASRPSLISAVGPSRRARTLPPEGTSSGNTPGPLPQAAGRYCSVPESAFIWPLVDFFAFLGSLAVITVILALDLELEGFATCRTSCACPCPSLPSAPESSGSSSAPLAASASRPSLEWTEDGDSERGRGAVHQVHVSRTILEAGGDVDPHHGIRRGRNRGRDRHRVGPAACQRRSGRSLSSRRLIGDLEDAGWSRTVAVVK